ANGYMGAKAECDKQQRTQLIALAALLIIATLFVFTPAIPLAFIAIEAAGGAAALVTLIAATRWKWKVGKWENAFKLLFDGQYEVARNAFLALRNDPASYHSFYYWDPSDPEMQNQSKHRQTIGSALLYSVFCIKHTCKKKIFAQNIRYAKQDLGDQTNGLLTISQQNIIKYLYDEPPSDGLGKRNEELLACKTPKISLGRAMITSALLSAMQAPCNTEGAPAIHNGWKTTLEKARQLLITHGEYFDCQARIVDPMISASSYASFRNFATTFSAKNLILLLESTVKYEGYDDAIKRFVNDTAFDENSGDDTDDEEE
ncbi:MAG: hypothetical protein P0S94_02610, partial [Simkaniaceae bacterium]|nr:hypothetical protein [Simkaniaceae bacterium]